MRRLLAWSVGVLAALGTLAVGAWMAVLTWWPERVLERTRTPAAVFAVMAWRPEALAGPAAARLGDLDAALVERGLQAALEDLRVGRRRLAYLVIAQRTWIDLASLAWQADCQAADPDLRTLARRAYAAGHHQRGLRWLRDAAGAGEGPPWPAAAGPLAPCGWRPATAGASALVAYALFQAGYDHRRPTSYREALRRSLRALAAGQDAQGRLAADPRDAAGALMALAHAYGASNDSDLKPTAQRAVDELIAERPPLGVDTTREVLELLALKEAQAAGLPVGEELERRKAAIAETLRDLEAEGGGAVVWRGAVDPGAHAAEACAALALQARYLGLRTLPAGLGRIRIEELRSPLGCLLGMLNAAFVGDEATKEALADRLRERALRTWDGRDGAWDGGAGDPAAVALALQAHLLRYRWR